tara:strand:+ start:8339 stop:8731 length:393 start_codon:yes stop_codon:yes gene_type:complete
MSQSTLTTKQRKLDEGTLAKYTATITDEAEAAIGSSSLTTLTLTLYDAETGTIINSRDDQNVLNTNNVTVDSAGLLTWLIQPGDNAIIGTRRRAGMYEKHVALFEYTWSSGSKASKHELTLEIRQLDKVT